MDAGEYGVVQRINCKLNLTGATNFRLDVLRPDGTQFSVVHADISIGTTELVTGDKEHGTYAANEWIYFTTKNDQFTLKGFYRADLIVDFGAGKKLKHVNAIIEVY